jgi:hypothetical protein
MKRKRFEDPAVRACEVFFNDLVQGYLREVPLERIPQPGKLQITLAGERRRTWTIDLGQRTIHRGGDSAADAFIEAEPEFLLFTVVGEVPWLAGLECGCIRHRGKAEVTSAFFDLIEALPPVPVQHGDPTMVN